MPPFRSIVFLILGLSAWGPVHAQASQDGGALLKALGDCRAIGEGPARLACFDQAAARFLEAEKTGAVVVVDREQARAAQKQTFGLSLSALNIFNRGGKEPEVDRVTLVLAHGVRDADGKWVLTAEDGQVWRQIGSHTLRRPPKRGSKAEVRRASLGSYFMNVDGQKAIRVHRDR